MVSQKQIKNNQLSPNTPLFMEHFFIRDIEIKTKINYLYIRHIKLFRKELEICHHNEWIVFEILSGFVIFNIVVLLVSGLKIYGSIKKFNNKIPFSHLNINPYLLPHFLCTWHGSSTLQKSPSTILESSSFSWHLPKQEFTLFGSVCKFRCDSIAIERMPFHQYNRRCVYSTCDTPTHFPPFPLTHISCVPVNSYSKNIGGMALYSAQIYGWVFPIVFYLLEITRKKDFHSLFVRSIMCSPVYQFILLPRDQTIDLPTIFGLVIHQVRWLKLWYLFVHVNFIEFWSDGSITLNANQWVFQYIPRGKSNYGQKCDKLCIYFINNI